MSGVMCHVSCVRCQVSLVTCHMSHATYHMSHVFFFFLESGEAYRGGSVINGAYPV